MRNLLSILVFVCTMSIKAQGQLTEENSPLLMGIFGNSSSDFFNVLSNPEKYKYQIIYTKINRSRRGHAHFETHFFNYNRNQFLYPASLVKLPLSLLALQKIHELGKYDILPNTDLIIDSSDWCQTSVYADPTQKSGRPNIEGYIKKMMLVSDNDAYNRTYEFLGYDYIYENLRNRGLKDIRIVQRFSPKCDSLSYYITNPFCFLKGNDTLYKQPATQALYRLHNPLGEIFMGIGYVDFSGFYFPFPRSFYYNNHLALEDLHQILKSVFFNAYNSSSKRFNVTESELNILRKYMGQWPRESEYPTYNLPDNYKKYFIIGNGSALPENSNIRIFNVVGRAYGVLADCAYIVDFKNNVEFMLSAIMYCNNNDILNDDIYEYDTVGLPFFSELGRLIYNYELRRNKKNPYCPFYLEKIFQK